LEKGRGKILIDPFIHDDIMPSGEYIVRMPDRMRFYAAGTMDIHQHYEDQIVRLDEFGKFLEPGRIYMATTPGIIQSTKYDIQFKVNPSLARYGLIVYSDVYFSPDGNLQVTLYPTIQTKIYAGLNVGSVVFIPRQ
jgi:hypothetical protein